MMIKFLGNTSSIIDWNNIVDSIKGQTPGYVGPRHSVDDDIFYIKEMDKLWKDAGFKLIKEGGTAGWDMFFPGTHFDASVVTKFADFINVDPVDCWISRIHPGNMTPWHWDCNDKEEEYSKLNINRYTCNISEPQYGHAIMVEDDCLYLQEQGSVWQWPSRTSWHGGINCGFAPKYLLNFSGIPK
jgi:hypothetical protein